jgi:hypothetical protein
VQASRGESGDAGGAGRPGDTACHALLLELAKSAGLEALREEGECGTRKRSWDMKVFWFEAAKGEVTANHRARRFRRDSDVYPEADQRGFRTRVCDARSRVLVPGGGRLREEEEGGW